MGIIDQTGGGKSTLLALMAYQFLKYPGATVTVLDRLGSFLVPCLCAGATGSSSAAAGSGCSPYAASATRTSAPGPRGRQALQHVGRLPPDERTLSALHASRRCGASGCGTATIPSW